MSGFLLFRYEKNIQILSRRLRDQPMPATKKAVFWLEYVLRHQGAHHLKSNAEGLSVWQYFLLDVVVAMILVVAVTAAVVYMLLKTTVSLVGRIRIHRYLKKKLN